MTTITFEQSRSIFFFFLFCFNKKKKKGKKEKRKKKKDINPHFYTYQETGNMAAPSDR